jgi:hypothetical protein
MGSIGFIVDCLVKPPTSVAEQQSPLLWDLSSRFLFQPSLEISVEAGALDVSKKAALAF